MNEQLLPQAQSRTRIPTHLLPVEIRIENLSKSFGNHRVFLDGINLVVFRGEMIAIVGGSASGKTTLLRQIIGLLYPEVGRVLVADHEAEGSPLVELATINAAGMERLQWHWAVVTFHGGMLRNCKTNSWHSTAKTFSHSCEELPYWALTSGPAEVHVQSSAGDSCSGVGT